MNNEEKTEIQKNNFNANRKALPELSLRLQIGRNGVLCVPAPNKQTFI
jgi:hypothetical protein